MCIILIIVLGLLYLISTLCACLYFEECKFELKIIHLIALLCPFWNTYFSIKYLSSLCFNDVKKWFKNQFTF